MSTIEMHARRVGMLVLIGSVMALVLAACGQEEPTATPVPTATPPPVVADEPTPTPDAAAAFEAEWEALIAAAQAEPELVLVLGGSAGRNYRPVVEFFGEKFGIELVISTGSGTAQANRVLAERQVGSYLVDILFVGPGRISLRAGEQRCVVVARFRVSVREILPNRRSDLGRVVTGHRLSRLALLDRKRVPYPPFPTYVADRYP